MGAPSAHTSKGLAKAFVSSAGGKGPELLSLQIKNFRPLFLLPLTSSEPQFKEQGLQLLALGYSVISRSQRVPFRFFVAVRCFRSHLTLLPRWGLLCFWPS